MPCQSCIEVDVQECDDIIIKTLPAALDLYWIVQKVGKTNIHQKKVTTNGDGELTIDIDDLPAGFLVTGDAIKIQLRLGSNYLTPVLFNTELNPCILANIVHTGTIEEDPDVPVNVISITHNIV